MGSIFEDQVFDRAFLAEHPLVKGEYESCIFRNADLSGMDLSGMKFSNCEFIGCNLSMARIDHTVFRDIVFSDCKLLGMQFDKCSQFGISFRFENCLLDHASFFGMKITRTIFRGCHLKEADFTGTDLSASSFDSSDLTGAVFMRSNIEKADFRTASGYTLDPESNRIKKAKFALSGVPGLLAGYQVEIDRSR